MKQIPEAVKTGGLAGQGYNNLLGRPRLGPMPLVLREAVQNSWDARRRGSTMTLRFAVRVRTLDARQDSAFRKIFVQDESVEPVRKNALAKQLQLKSRIRVLELSDFGTVGLSGLYRPDLPSGGEESRFVNFFFDFGRSHEESGDGGTYGFGRSSLYTSGKASLILADSLARAGASIERRVMACRIGEAFEVTSGPARGRYSGRHFWGREKDDVAQPLVGAAAEAVAERLGLPERSAVAHTGTTIMIPWPVEEFNDGAEIARVLLRHLWPKMVPTSAHAEIKFDVEVDGEKVPMKNPADTDEYRLFVRALKMARTKRPGGGATAIETLKPRQVTGYLGVSAGVVSASTKQPLRADEEESDDQSESPLNQVALMRPSELVVRYLPVAGTELLDRSWAGVFICDDDEEVRTSFARAEPPAHDDWIADRVGEKRQKYLVRKTVQTLLPDAVREVLGLGRPGAGGEREEGPSLASTSARFSAKFLAGDGQGPALASDGATESPGGRDPSVGRSAGGGPRVTAPVPVGLEWDAGRRLAMFRVTVHGRPGAELVLRAVPAVHADGMLDAPPEGLLPPCVVRWSEGVVDRDWCILRLAQQRKDVDIGVEIRDDYGVTLKCTVEESQG